MYRSCEGQQRGRESGEWRVYLADVFLLLIAIQAGIWGNSVRPNHGGSVSEKYL